MASGTLYGRTSAGAFWCSSSSPDGICWWTVHRAGKHDVASAGRRGSVRRKTPLTRPLSRTSGCDANSEGSVSPGASCDSNCSAGPDMVLSHTEEKKVEGLNGRRVLTEIARSFPEIASMQSSSFPELLSLSTHLLLQVLLFLGSWIFSHERLHKFLLDLLINSGW